MLALQLALSCPSGVLSKEQDSADQRTTSDARNAVGDGPVDDQGAGEDAHEDDASIDSGQPHCLRQVRVP